MPQRHQPPSRLPGNSSDQCPFDERAAGEPQEEILESERLVTLVASCQIPFPQNLNPADALVLAGNVQARRRQVLIRWIARQTARAMTVP